MCTPSRRLLSRTFKFASSAGAITAALALAVTAWAGEKRNDEMFVLKTVIPIPGSPLVSFDISWVDPVLHKYYLADRNNKSVDVIDTSTTPPSFLTQFIPTNPGFVGARTIDDQGNVGCTIGALDPSCAGSNDISGPDGVLTVDHKELWVGDGESRVWVLDAKDGHVLTLPGGASNPIPTSPVGTNHRRADELCYDSADHLVLVANNADVPPFASIISTQTYTVVSGGKIVFDGNNGVPHADGIEQCQWSPVTGKFYISIPQLHGQDDGVGAVAVIDPKTKKVVAVFPIPVDDCAAPQGMAVGPAPQILLGCNGAHPDGVFNTVIINESSGHVMTTLANEGGNDEVWFNPGDGHYALARGQFLPDEFLGIVDSRFRAQDQSVQTGTANGTTRRTHSVAADLNTNLIYMPIPATGGGGSVTPTPTAGFQSAICGDTTTLQGAGCVAVFGTTNDDRPSIAHERGPDDKQE
jgi:hypothetical protein